MAKYFSTYYLNETTFQQQEEQENSQKYFIRYLNSFLISLGVVNLFFKEEIPHVKKELIRKKNTTQITNLPIKNSLIDIPITNTSRKETITEPPMENKKKQQDYSINIKFLIPIKEKDVSLFLSDVLEYLSNVQEESAFIEVKRNTNGVVDGIYINDIKNAKNLQNLFEQIQHDKNIIVTAQ